jgi:AmmeMemoRadiSam system protein A
MPPEPPEVDSEAAPGAAAVGAPAAAPAPAADVAVAVTIQEQGLVLLALARGAICAALEDALALAPAPSRVPPPRLDAAWLRAAGACFVTLTRKGRLRGCIGSVRARRPLGDDVRANARAAALADPRFPPLTVAELADVRIEVSLLSPPAPLPAAASEEEALAALRPGIDGIILEYGGEAHATFLPQVWESLPAPQDFLSHLKHKAGLPPDFWSPALRLQRYTVTRWEEPE